MIEKEQIKNIDNHTNFNLVSKENDNDIDKVFNFNYFNSNCMNY